MFGKKSKARLVAGLLVLGALAVPGAAQAAEPSIVSFTVFGNIRPGDPLPATDPALAPNMGSDTIFANSRPFGYRYEHGLLYIEGEAAGTVDGDGKLRLQVDVAVSDPDGNTITRTLAVRSVAEPEFDEPQGYFETSFAVTQLGGHTATGTDPQSANPADWGGTVLTVTAVARNVGGETSVPAQTTITKYAATPKDTFAPSLSRIKWPPSNWCHFSSKGMEDPIFGFHFDGTSEGGCGTITGVEAFPDVTWAGCVEWFDPFLNLRDLTTDPTGFFGNFTEHPHLYGQGCRDEPSDHHNDDQYVPSGHARVTGHADDMTGSGASGIASEIADIKIEVTQDGVPIREIHNFDRPDGPQGQWNFAMSINDFAPTSFGGDVFGTGITDFAPPYILKVTACDAWANCSTTSSPEIRVYPY